MTNNELSRKVISMLGSSDGAMKFKTMAKEVGVDIRTIFKNLFYLEEHNLVQLSTSYPTDAVYPQIHLVRLRQKGRDLAGDPEMMEQEFPSSDMTSDTSPHIPPDLKERKQISISQVLDQFKAQLDREDISDEKKAELREKISELQGLSAAKHLVEV